MFDALRTPLLVLTLLTVSMAGCADEGAVDPTEEVGSTKKVETTSTTGGIRGVVVDSSITPLADVTVILTGQDKETTTDANGEFVFGLLEPGAYFLQTQHPLYVSVQQNAEVVAGVETPKAVKIVLERNAVSDPYALTQKFEGYIFCSANIFVPGIGGILSEECGEGVGVPGQGRIGGNPDNNAQLDFYLDNGDARTIMAEAVWTPTQEIGGSGGQFNMGIYTGFSCDPVCGWDAQIDRQDGGSPLILRNDNELGYSGDTSLEGFEFDEETRFSTFTWAGAGETGVLLEQRFQMFQTASYGLPLPDAWSFVAGDDSPF
jgi:hypothetical protein